MKSIAYFNIPAYGHIRPTLPVVEQLVQRGARVLYFIDEAHRDAVAATGAEVRVISNHTGLPQVVPSSLAEFAALLAETTYHNLPSMVETVKSENIGLIMHDSICVWGHYVAEPAGLPSIRSCGVLMAYDKALPREKTPIREILIHVNLSQWMRYRRWRRKLLRETALQRIRIDEVLRTSADRTLVFTSKEFIPGSERLGEDTEFVGASFSDTGSTEFVVPEHGDRPLIYISLGTTFTDAQAFYRSCKEAFAPVNGAVVMSLGRKVDPQALEPWPDNFTAAPYVPQLEILQHASVFVTQTGGCSVMTGPMARGATRHVAPFCGTYVQREMRSTAEGGSGAPRRGSERPTPSRDRARGLCGSRVPSRR